MQFPVGPYKVLETEGPVDSPWVLGQLLWKPNVGVVGGDDKFRQYWALLDDTAVGVDDGLLWTSTSEAPEDRARLTRRWAELAYWFQPLSGPAGSRAVRALGDAGNFAATEIGGTGGVFSRYSSHTYATSLPLFKVIALYNEIQRWFENR